MAVVGVLTLLLYASYVLMSGAISQKLVKTADGNGVLRCVPGVEFPRDCGNRCVCNKDGLGATCTDRPCPADPNAFDVANARVYREIQGLRDEQRGPVFFCEPYTKRRVTQGGAYCYCARSGTAEICSARKGKPWD